MQQVGMGGVTEEGQCRNPETARLEPLPGGGGGRGGCAGTGAGGLPDPRTVILRPGQLTPPSCADRQDEREKACPAVSPARALCLGLGMLGLATRASVDGKTRLLFPAAPPNLCLVGISHNTEGALGHWGFLGHLFIVPLNPDTNRLFIHALLGRGTCLLKPQRKPLTQAGNHGDA